MKKQTDAQKKQLENDLRDCMKCKFFGECQSVHT